LALGHWRSDRYDMIDRCVQAPDSLKFDVFNAISDNRFRWRDIDHPKEILGWQPSGHAENYEIDDKDGWHQLLEGDQTLGREA